MGFWDRFASSRVRKVYREGDGYFYETWSQNAEYSERKKLKLVLQNPAALSLFTLLPDLAAQGKYVLKRAGEPDAEPEDSHPLLDLLNNPNHMQTGNQFIWDYMFWRLLGTANLYTDSEVLKGEDNVLYWLSPDCINWPKWFEENKDTLFVSKQSKRELREKVLEYETFSQKLSFKYKNLRQFHDISNGMGNWFKGPSKVDALHKIISNSDKALDAKNTMTILGGKYIVAGKHDVTNTSTTPMTSVEKKNVESKVMGGRSIFAMKSMVDIKRFIEDMGALEKIDRAYMNDAFNIGKVLNIPRDVIESLSEGSTYENQEKARASVIYYCVESAMQDFTQGITSLFGITDYVLSLDYSHLPFVQTFEKDKAETADKKASAFKKLVDSGADQEEAANLLGLDLTMFSEPRRMTGFGRTVE